MKAVSSYCKVAALLLIQIATLFRFQPILGASCPTPGFASAGTFNVGPTPVSVAAGDFNKDGNPDLAVGNQGSNSNHYTNGSVSIFLGEGDGTFHGTVNYDMGTNLTFVAVGDFDLDGNLDLAALTSNGYGSFGTVSILLGNGGGSFRPAARYEISGVNARSLAVGDVNGDNKPDIVAGGHWMDVLLGNGDGTFATSFTYEHPGDERPTFLRNSDHVRETTGVYHV